MYNSLILYNTIWITREKGITTLRTYQYWIFHNTVIETCFEILKSSETEELGRYLSYISPNLFFRLFWSFLAVPPMSIYYPFRTFSIPWLWWIIYSCIYSKNRIRREGIVITKPRPNSCCSAVLAKKYLQFWLLIFAT